MCEHVIDRDSSNSSSDGEDQAYMHFRCVNRSGGMMLVNSDHSGTGSLSF